MYVLSSRKCKVCEKEEATGECIVCGRAVCTGCLVDRQQETCLACASFLCQVCRSKLAFDVCVLCGRLICYKCSHEINSAQRVCTTCYHGDSNIIGELNKRVTRAKQELEKRLASLATSYRSQS